MNLGDIRLIVTNQIHASRRTIGTDPNYLIDRFANEAVRSVLIDTRCFVQPGDLLLVAGEQDFRLDNRILAVVGTFGPDSNRVQEVTPQDIYDKRRLDTTTTSEKTYVALVGDDLLLIYPTPTEDLTLTYYYVPKPTEMTQASHDPSADTYGGIPVQYHRAIELYALWRMAEFSEPSYYSRGKVFSPGYIYQGQYQDEVQRIKRSIVRKTGHPLPRAKLAPIQSAVRNFPSDPSVVWRGW